MIVLLIHTYYSLISRRLYRIIYCVDSREKPCLYEGYKSCVLVLLYSALLFLQKDSNCFGKLLVK